MGNPRVGRLARYRRQIQSLRGPNRKRLASVTKRQRESLRRSNRKRLARITKLRISTQPAVHRTLRPGARRMLRRTRALYIYILPWIKELTHRYSPIIHPPSSFLGLPTELRQKILLLTVSWAQLERWDRQKLQKWIGDLSCVSPLVRLDMLYISQVWRNEQATIMEMKRLAKEKGKNNIKLYSIERAVQLNSRLVRGSEMKIKGKERRTRDRKCWYCEQRHFSVDPVCPKARKDPGQWNLMTKPVRVKRVGIRKKPRNTFQGTKTIFYE